MPGVQVALWAGLVPAHCGDQQLCHVEGEIGVIGDEGQVPGAEHHRDGIKKSKSSA